MQERLDKFLASQSLGSRKAVKETIRSGAVAVNGVPVLDAARKLDPERDRVTVDGRGIGYRRFSYIMMHKPAGVLSASSDRRSRTVLDLLSPELWRRGLFPAGRLDKDTTGLLILTDDGDFAHRMLSPKSHVPKLYEAAVDRPVTPEDEKAFAEGIEEGGDHFAPARLWTEDRQGGQAVFVELREGKFHQVKRMFAAVGAQVISLRRLKIGGLWLDPTLQEGEARFLRPEEVALLLEKSIVSLHQNEGPDLDFRENP